jgi:hypothetical protein
MDNESDNREWKARRRVLLDLHRLAAYEKTLRMIADGLPQGIAQHMAEEILRAEEAGLPRP